MRRCFLLATLLTLAAPSLFSDAGRAEPAAVPPRISADLRVAVVQMRSSRDIARNIHKIVGNLSRCANDGVRVVVFPECALTGYFDDAYMKALSVEQLADAERKVAKACRANQIYAIVGTVYREGDRLYDSAVVISPDGEIRARYCKLQLAESWATAGEQLSVFRIDEVRASIIICHDERYPELVRLPVLAGARVIFYLSHESGLANESKLVPYRADSGPSGRKHGVRRPGQCSCKFGCNGLARTESADRSGRQPD